MRLPTTMLALSLFVPLASVAQAKKAAAAPGPRTRPDAAQAATDADVVLRTRAGILRAEDERNAADPAIAAALGHPVAALRARAVRALGRIGDPGAMALVTRALGDADLEVRREAVFALGEIDDPAALSSLLRAALSDDAEQRALAAEALAKIAWRGADKVRAGGFVLEHFLQPGAERDPAVAARAVRACWRFGADVPGLVQAIANSYLRPEPAISEAAAYAASRMGDSRLGSMLELATRDDRPDVRAAACRGLSRLARGKEPEKERTLDRRALLIRRALDVSPFVRLSALGALQPFPPAEPVITQEIMDVTLRSQDPGLQRFALALVGEWRVQHELPAVMRLVQQAPRDVFPEAAAALVRLMGEDALPALTRAAESSDWTRRAAVAQAIGVEEMGRSKAALSLQDALLADGDARVVAAALGAATSCGRHDADLLALAHLGAKDSVVRAVAASALPESLGDHVTKDEAAAALRRCRREASADESDDVRISALEALADLLGTAAKDDVTAAMSAPQWTVRLKARELLARLGLPAPPPGIVGLARPLGFYLERAAAQMSPEPKTLRLETDRGVIDVALATAEAPLTVFQLTELAGRGWFDGLSFHRVVPDFVAQGGCPRGDGWGGPAMNVRCEINRLPYDRGAAGMALSGKDTGGSQFFFTLAPQPHLDGGYTVFGHVTPETMPVVDALRRFDTIHHAVVLAGSGSSVQASSK